MNLWIIKYFPFMICVRIFLSNRFLTDIWQCKQTKFLHRIESKWLCYFSSRNEKYLREKLKYAFERLCYVSVSHARGLLSCRQFLSFQKLVLCLTAIWSQIGTDDLFWPITKNLPSADVPTETPGLGCPPWLWAQRTESAWEQCNQVFPSKHSTEGLGKILRILHA